MKIEEIKELIQLFNESGVAELEVQRGENRVCIRRAATSQEVVLPAQVAAAPAVAVPTATPSTAAPPAAPAEPESTDVMVRSPIVGTYYDSPSPGSPPFVKVGDSVEPGQVLCIIESMKLMNEIEAESAGVVASTLVENGRPVEYGEALFALRPR
ncbi:MAG: acetyl-CoA carboxylase biotin carboxyl carrier protein [Bryobacteraceae bacterium]